MIEVLPTSIAGLKLIKPKVFEDERGFFFESYNRADFDQVGVSEQFVQDNRSKSVKGVLRGLHFQRNRPQGKLVSVTSGEVLDVAVDLRPESTTYGQYEAFRLNDQNRLSLYVPPRFAHGFLVLSETAEFQYKCTDFYDPSDEGSIVWNDPDLNINWGGNTSPALSDKDRNAPNWSDIRGDLEPLWRVE